VIIGKPGEISPGSFFMSTITIKENVSLADHTTIGIGGPAAHFAAVATPEELIQALEWSRKQNLQVLVLGGGSNLLVADCGWPGLVIKIAIGGIDSPRIEDENRVRLVCGGGVAWDDFVAYSVDLGLQGIECLSGIPGTVGASPIQNIGAYGQEVRETIAWVEVMERETGQIQQFSNADCGFGYRWSRFKGNDKDRYVVLRVAFDLAEGAPPALRYGDLTRYFEANKIANPSLIDVRRAVIEVRRSKGMVIDPEIADSRSCGSFFMNPIVDQETVARVREIALQKGLMSAEEKMPEFPAGGGKVKLSAAWLMERAGLKKGEVRGNVGLSSRHVLALINCGGGTSDEVQAMVRHAQQTVQNRFGIDLHPEPVFVGFDPMSKSTQSPK